MIENTTAPRIKKDIRELEITEVCKIGEWIEKYRRLEHPTPRNTKDLLKILVKDTREFEGDFGVFGLEG
jgi:hypothetical protein